MCLFQFSTCFGQPSAHHQENQLYQYIMWYITPCRWLSGMQVSDLHTRRPHTYLLTPWSRVLLEKLTGSAASQEFSRIFGTRRFITVLTSARHLSLSWANSIQSSQLPPTSWRCEYASFIWWIPHSPFVTREVRTVFRNFMRFFKNIFRLCISSLKSRTESVIRYIMSRYASEYNLHISSQILLRFGA